MPLFSIPELEIIQRLPPKTTSTKPPILFVHGAYVSAWCWDEHFLPFFAQAGYPSYAVSLRGHGTSAGRDKIDEVSLDDYINDVAIMVASIRNLHGVQPILVGHSMGGYVLQQYLVQQTTQGATNTADTFKLALLAPVPPQGLLPLMYWLAWTQPWLMQQMGLLQMGVLQPKDSPYFSSQLLSQALFSKHLPPEHASRYLARTQHESQRALLQMSHWDIAATVAKMPAQQVLVLGAADDVLVPPAAVYATAMAYGVQATILPSLGHIMMLEANWLTAAKQLLDWLSPEA